MALVTGAGRGIGKATAFALSDAGASVAIYACSEEEISVTATGIVAREGHALAVRADVSDRRDVERMATEVEREMGPLDLLVNNAGVHGPIGPLVAGGQRSSDAFQVNLTTISGTSPTSGAIDGGTAV